MFDGAFAVAVVRNGYRMTFDSWATARTCVEIGDQVRGYMPDGSTSYAGVIPLDDPSLGPSRWRAIVMPW